MDGLEQRGEITVIGTTNRVDAIDPALRRPGRFDREIEIGVPDTAGREEILGIHTRGMPLGDGVDLERYAENTHGFVGADLENLAKEAAMTAMRRVRPELDLDDDEIDARCSRPSRSRQPTSRAPVAGSNPPRCARSSSRCPTSAGTMWAASWTPKSACARASSGRWNTRTRTSGSRSSQPKASCCTVRRGPGRPCSRKRGKRVPVELHLGQGARTLRQVRRRVRKGRPRGVQQGPRERADDRLLRRDRRHRERARQRRRRLERRRAGRLPVVDRTRRARGTRGRRGHRGLEPTGTNRRRAVAARPTRSSRRGRRADEDGRREVFAIHTRDRPLAADIDLDGLAAETEGYTGADIEAVCREAATIAVREHVHAAAAGEDRDADEIELTADHFERALEDISPESGTALESGLRAGDVDEVLEGGETEVDAK